MCDTPLLSLRPRSGPGLPLGLGYKGVLCALISFYGAWRPAALATELYADIAAPRLKSMGRTFEPEMASETAALLDLEQFSSHHVLAVHTSEIFRAVRRHQC
ncbi:hypothetical protein [Ferrimicrobium sp.]|uniref:hypothetical protein n=1 Tax=Ferrimicrobium sp. TaxID=2926050 RepID=UPI002606EBB5|nr:hypothetical protein [Ferrimicrobium sp.]